MNWLLALHLVALAMGTGMSFSNFISFQVARAMDDSRKQALAAQRATLGRIGDLVIAAIWLTGLALTWRMLAGNTGAATAMPGAFHLKMLFVLTLTGCHATSRWAGVQIMRHGRKELLPLARNCTLGVFASAVLSIILALAAFH